MVIYNQPTIFNVNKIEYHDWHLHCVSVWHSKFLFIVMIPQKPVGW